MTPDFNLSNAPNPLKSALSPSISASSSATTFNKQHHPATFVTKLYLMVDDISTNAYIRWGPDGDSFTVLYPEEFAREILPRFFKHNNFSSFVRQLNMYGFHKVPHITTSAPVSAFDGSNNAGDYFSRALSIQTNTFASNSFPSYTNSWEFSHENFRRNHPNLLMHVRRKVQHQTNNSQSSIIPMSQNTKPIQDMTSLGPLLNNNTNSHHSQTSLFNIFSNPDLSSKLLEYLAYNAGSTTTTSASPSSTIQNGPSASLPLAIGSSSPKESHFIFPHLENQVSPADLSTILSELTAIKTQQKQILEKLSHLEIDQSMLWRDSMKCRDRCNSQQELIEKILRFLASVFTSGDKKLKEGIAGLFNTLNHLQPSISSASISHNNPDKLSSSEFNSYGGDIDENELDLNYPDSLNNNSLFSGQWPTTESKSSLQNNFFSPHIPNGQYSKRQKLIANVGSNNPELEVFSELTSSSTPSPTFMHHAPIPNNYESEPGDLDNLEDVENALGPDFDLASFLNTEIAYSEDNWSSTSNTTKPLDLK